MKFLCVKCDSQMQLAGTTAHAEQGSLSIVYRCQKCGQETAMLTNRAETQLVSSLGVEIRPPGAPAAPAESAGKCPFGAMLQGGAAQSAGAAADNGIRWNSDASERLDKVPAMIRPMAQMGIEQYARQHGHTEITLAVLESAKSQFGF